VTVIAPITPSQIKNLQKENAPEESRIRLIVVIVANKSQANLRAKRPTTATTIRTMRSV